MNVEVAKHIPKKYRLKSDNETPPGGYRIESLGIFGLTPECVSNAASFAGFNIKREDVVEFTIQSLIKRGEWNSLTYDSPKITDFNNYPTPTISDKSLLVVLPVHGGDIDRGVENHKYHIALQNGDKLPFDAILIAEPDTPIEWLEQYCILSKELFQNVKGVFVLPDIISGRSFFPVGNNNMFRHIAQHVFLSTIDNEYRYSHFFNFETDVLGLQKDWLLKWWETFKESKKTLSGYLGEAIGIQHVNGLAIYPFDIIKRHKAVCDPGNVAWDLAIGTDLLDQTYVANEFYIMLWNTSNFLFHEPTSCVIHNNCPVYNVLDKSKLLIHGCKDLSLNRILTEKLL